MDIIQREIDTISAELLKKLDAGEGETPQYRELYAAQQALCWAREPASVAGPFDTVMRGDPVAQNGSAS